MACERCGAALTGSPSDSARLCERCAIELSPTLEAATPAPPASPAAELSDGLAAPSGADALAEGGPGHPAALRGGDRLGAYTIRGEIGRGGMAVVYRAEQAGLDREVALKVLAGGPGASRERVERFLREARAAARLSHPNIVRVHEVGEDRGVRYLAMELVEGTSLDARLRAETVDWRLAATVVRDTARALHHAHGEGIVHRDVKPGNILIGHDGVIKVTDFGLARVEGGRGLTADGTAIGTPAYMSPEQAAGDQAAVGAATDVYACGAVLYECLTGRPPAIGESVLEVLHAVQVVDPPPVRRLAPGVPADLATVAEQALRKDRGDRYATAEELAQELDRVLDGAPVRARPIGAVSRVLRRVRRHPVVSAAVAVGVLGVAAAAVAFSTLAGEWAASGRESARQAARVSAQPAFERARARLEQARKARAAGDDEHATRAATEARSALAAVLAADPDWPEALLCSAQLATFAHDSGQALVALDRALALDPRLTDASYERARLRFDRYFATNVLAGLHDPEAAAPLRADLEHLVAQESRPERAHAARAMQALFAGDYPAAEAAVAQALAENPYFADAFALRGAVHIGQGHALLMKRQPAEARRAFTDAVADFDAAIRHGADPDLILAGRAHARAQSAQVREALADAERLVSLDPDDPSRLFLRARMRKLQGDDGGAAADMERARALAGDTAEGHMQAATVLLANLEQRRGRAVVTTDDLAAARADLDWVVQNAPMHDAARFYRAVVHHHEGNTDACRADLEVFLEQPGGTEAFRDVARAWVQGLRAQAEGETVAQELTLRVEPLRHLAEVQEAYQAGMTLIRQGKAQEAEPRFRAALGKIDAAQDALTVTMDSAEGKALVQVLRAARDEARDEARKPAPRPQAPAAAPADSGEKRGGIRDQIERALREKLAFGREYVGEVRQRANYNIACALALRCAAAAAGTPARAALADESFVHLDHAVAAGWADWRHMEHDDDLAALRDDPRYAKVLDACRARAKRAGERERRRERDEDD